MNGKADVSVERFREMALGFEGAVEAAHMGHPDFRANGRIFATVGYPDEQWGMVKLTPEEQAIFVRAEPTSFKPCNGAWGRSGSTNVRLATVPSATLREVLKLAWDGAMRAKKGRKALESAKKQTRIAQMQGQKKPRKN
jgi:hypothetical protein